MKPVHAGPGKPAGRARRPFVSPRLVRYGKVERITMASGDFTLSVGDSGGYFG